MLPHSHRPPYTGPKCRSSATGSAVRQADIVYSTTKSADPRKAPERQKLDGKSPVPRDHIASVGRQTLSNFASRPQYSFGTSGMRTKHRRGGPISPSETLSPVKYDAEKTVGGGGVGPTAKKPVYLAKDLLSTTDNTVRTISIAPMSTLPPRAQDGLKHYPETPGPGLASEHYAIPFSKEHKHQFAREARQVTATSAPAKDPRGPGSYSYNNRKCKRYTTRNFTVTASTLGETQTDSNVESAPSYSFASKPHKVTVEPEETTVIEKKDFRNHPDRWSRVLRTQDFVEDPKLY